MPVVAFFYVGISALLASCTLPSVSQGTRSGIASEIQPGIPMEEARADLQSKNYRCEMRKGTYFDESGQAHAVSSPFLVCTARPSVVSFQCNFRTQVIVIAQGKYVKNVQISKAPSCIKP